LESSVSFFSISKNTTVPQKEQKQSEIQQSSLGVSEGISLDSQQVVSVSQPPNAPATIGNKVSVIKKNADNMLIVFFTISKIQILIHFCHAKLIPKICSFC